MVIIYEDSLCYYHIQLASLALNLSCVYSSLPWVPYVPSCLTFFAVLGVLNAYAIQCFGGTLYALILHQKWVFDALTMSFVSCVHNTEGYSLETFLDFRPPKLQSEKRRSSGHFLRPQTKSTLVAEGHLGWFVLVHKGSCRVTRALESDKKIF